MFDGEGRADEIPGLPDGEVPLRLLAVRQAHAFQPAAHDVVDEPLIRDDDDRAAAGDEHAAHFLERLRRIEEVLQRAEAGDDLERPIGIRERLGVTAAKIALGRERAGPSERGIGDVDPERSQARALGLHEEVPAAAGDIEQPVTGFGPAEREAARVVLLALAHVGRRPDVLVIGAQRFGRADLRHAISQRCSIRDVPISDAAPETRNANRFEW